MRKIIRVAASSVNQTPLDWERNFSNIQKSIDEAKSLEVDLLVLPELASTGYGCEDAFFMEGVTEESIERLLNLDIPENQVVVVGLPLSIGGRIYNGSAVLTSKRGHVVVNAIFLKQNLAKNGVHYETRWFNPWPKGQVVNINIGDDSVPCGDLTVMVDGIKIGCETCEDAWIASRPGVSLFEKSVDVIINPSASHFALGKYETRKQFVVEGSRAFGAAYVYTNLNGCEAGRTVFDGGNMIASGGKVISRGKRLFYKPIDVIVADIDVWENRLTQQVSSQSVVPKEDDSIIINKVLNGIDYKLDHSLSYDSMWQDDFENIEFEEATRAVALGLHDWLQKTRTNGFALSLSGGADSGLVASEIAVMIRALMFEYECYSQDSKSIINADCLPDLLKSFWKEGMEELGNDEEIAKALTEAILVTFYQGTENSGKVTENAASELAKGIGAKFYNWKVDQPVSFYTDLIEDSIGRELDWNDYGDDLALQNIQARSRAPSGWMLANVQNRLLVSTGNLSEMAVGYYTSCGDDAGGLSPISGIRKTRVRSMLSWLSGEGIHAGLMLSPKVRFTIPELVYIVKQQPTAELRPGIQEDEDDLMPFPILDKITNEFLIKRRNPNTIFEILCEDFSEFEKIKLAGFVVRYFELFSRNQWKRDRAASGFHIEADSLDHKTFARFPILNSGFQSELKKLREIV